MGCGATASAKYAPDQSKPGTGTASSSSARADDAPTPGLAPKNSGRPSIGESEAEKRSAESGDAKARKKSRIGKDVEGVRKWTREECEKLSICHLVRWLEALPKDVSPAVNREKTIQRLWKEISTKKPPALQTVASAENLNWWPLQELLKWLEYFECDHEVADKPALIEMLMENGESLPAPSFLGNSAEHDYLTQIQQHVNLLKNSSHSLLSELAKEITEVESQLNEEGKAPDHYWTATGLVVEGFKGAEAQAELRERGDSSHDQEHYFLDVSFGEKVDLIQRDPSGWCWCIAANGRGQGYAPSNNVIDIAQVLITHGLEGDNNGTLPVQQDEELEVLVRHYSGWTLCRNSAMAEGWVPDTCLSENPRLQATKQHRLILNGLHALAQDAYGVEASFLKLRSQQAGGVEASNGGNEEPVTLGGLYSQVLALIDEYKNICEALEVNAAAQSTSRTGKSSPDRRKSTRKGSKDDERKKHHLPEWVYVDSKCVWTSKTQSNKQLAVTIRKVCYQRLQVLVVFDDTPTHRKIIEFKTLKDPACQLGPRPENFRRKRKKAKGEALAAVEKEEADLANDLRGLAEDLGAEALASARLLTARSNRNSQRGSSGDSDSDRSTSTSSTAVPPPEGGSDPSKSEAEEEAKKAAAALLFQLGWRSHVARKRATSRFAQQISQRYIEEAQRAIELRKRHEEAAIRIQTRQRSIMARRLAADKARAKAEAAERAAKAAADAAARAKAEAEDAAATRIQALVRSWIARRRIKATQILQHAVHITYVRWRAIDMLRRFKKQKDDKEAAAALVIQRNIRGYQGRRKVRARKAEQEELKHVADKNYAAVVIQGVCRGHLKRLIVFDLQVRYHSAAKIQAAVRGRQTRRVQGPRLAEFKAKRVAAALVIQAGYRGIRDRRQVAEYKRVKGVPATKIQKVWRGSHNRAWTKPLIKKRAKAAVMIQRCWRGRMGRKKATQRLKDRSATLIACAILTRAAKLRLENYRQERKEFLAAVKIQSNWRRVRAGKRVAALREKRKQERAVTRIQANWRGLLGRRAVLERRIQAANEFLDTLLKGDVSFGAKRDQAWLRKVLAALEHKEHQEADKGNHEMELRRRQEAGRLPQGDDKLALRMKGTAAMDRGLAAVAVARSREILRIRAILYGQVLQVETGPTHECDHSMVAATLVNEGLLARLAPDDAVAEISSLIQAAWAMAASSGTLENPAQRPKGIPSPFEVLKSSINALVGRLAGETLGETSTLPEDSLECNTETQSYVKQAEARAKTLLDLSLGPIREEIKAIRAATPTVVKTAKEAAAKVPEEVKVLREKRDHEKVEAEAKLREDREQKHAQTQALHEIALQTQIEKERLEGALYNENSKKGPKVYTLVIENVKNLQQQIKDLEVHGTSNRKNQGILDHSLRALLVRATKAAGDMKTYQYVHPGEKLEDDDYTPSETVKKKMAKKEENELEFRAALEAEVLQLRRTMDAQATHEGAELGAKLRAEAEIHGNEAQELAQRLRTWRNIVAEAKPWLAVLQPLARVNVMVNRASIRMKKYRGNGDFGVVVRAILPTFKKIQKELPKAEMVDTPREDDVGKLAAALGDIKNKMASLLKSYPDPEVISPNAAQDLLTRRSNLDDEDEQAGHLVTPGKLRPTDKIKARVHLSPGQDDWPDDEDSGPKKTTFEKTKSLPARNGSKAVSATTGLAGFAMMGEELNALKEMLGNAAGATNTSLPGTSPSKSFPPTSALRASPRPPTASPGTSPGSPEPAPKAEPAARTTAQRPQSAAATRKVTLNPTSATENAEVQRTRPRTQTALSTEDTKARRQRQSVSAASQGQQPTSSGAGMKAVQDKRNKTANAWS